jgi:hypothetical protein
VGDPRVTAAAASRYWVFQGLAYRGTESTGLRPWVSLGPLSSVEPDGTQPNFSGRVAALAISPTCEVEGPCRL